MRTRATPSVCDEAPSSDVVTSWLVVEIDAARASVASPILIIGSLRRRVSELVVNVEVGIET